MYLVRKRIAASLPVLGLALALGGCGSVFGYGETYPKLRDIPPPPTDVTPEDERERIKRELDRERTDEDVAPTEPGAATGKPPAVPPKPKPQAFLAEDGGTSECKTIAEVIEASKAIPRLRGTIAEPRPVRLAQAGSGITGSIESAPVAIEFDPGSAELSASAVRTLDNEAARFMEGDAQGAVYVDSRGEARNYPPGAVRRLEGVSLALRRASAIANFLIAAGVPAERIEILAGGEEPSLSSPGARASADVARVRFELGR